MVARYMVPFSICVFFIHSVSDVLFFIVLIFRVTVCGRKRAKGTFLKEKSPFGVPKDLLCDCNAMDLLVFGYIPKGFMKSKQPFGIPKDLLWRCQPASG